MHPVSVVATLLLAETPSPDPVAPPNELVTPGPAGFLAILVVALAGFLLVWDMNRRVRRARYRDELADELDAELAAQQAAEAAALGDPGVGGDTPVAERGSGSVDPESGSAGAETGPVDPDPGPKDPEPEPGDLRH